MKTTGLKDPRSDGGLVAFRRGIGAVPDSWDIYSGKGNNKYVKKEFDCIGTYIFKKWRSCRARKALWPHIFKASLSLSSVKSGTELVCPRSSRRDISRFVFSVLSSLYISILLTPAYYFMKMPAFFLSDV